MDSIYQSVVQQFDPTMGSFTSFSSYMPQMAQYGSFFSGLAAQFSQMFSSSMPPTPAQQAAIDYVLKDKNSYMCVYTALNDTTNSYLAWTKGNFTKYGPVFQGLIQQYDDALKKANETIMMKRKECGTNDGMSAKMQEIMPGYSIFYSGYSNALNSFQNLYSMINMNLLTSMQSAFSTVMYDSDPMATIKAAESTMIYPNAKLIQAQITNLGDTMIWIITKSMDAQVTNAKTAIANVTTIAKTYPCTGQ